MVDPFITGDIRYLVSAAKALQTVLVQCWPRIRGSVHVNDALTAVATCWTNLQASADGRNIEAGPFAEAASELRHTARTLLKLAEASEKSYQLVVGRLVAVEPELRDLVSR